MDVSTDVCLTWRIDAPTTRVWDCMSDADLLSLWLGKVGDGAVDAGSEFVVDHGGNYRCRSTVVTYAEATRLDFNRHSPTSQNPRSPSSSMDGGRYQPAADSQRIR